MSKIGFLIGVNSVHHCNYFTIQGSNPEKDSNISLKTIFISAGDIFMENFNICFIIASHQNITISCTLLFSVHSPKTQQNNGCVH